MVNPLFVIFDLAVIVLATRSMLILGRSALWTSLGWAFTIAYGAAAALEFSSPDRSFHHAAGFVATGALLLMTVSFIVAGFRDEPQAEPWAWPTRVGQTRAQRRG
jgi:hypothetical protein